MIAMTMEKLQDWLFAPMLYIINLPYHDDNLHNKSLFLCICDDER